MQKLPVWVFIGLGIILLVFLLSIDAPLQKASHKIKLIAIGQTEEEWCAQTADFIERTAIDGVCGEDEDPFVSADCCLGTCVATQYNWFC